MAARPNTSANTDEWTAYLYDKPNIRGLQTEWWHHRSGCKAWMIVERDTNTNTVHSTRRAQTQENTGA